MTAPNQPEDFTRTLCESMAEALRGQMQTLIALSTLVPREMRPEIEERIASHAQWIVKLAWGVGSEERT
jgi:hypothetical protein